MSGVNSSVNEANSNMGRGLQVVKVEGDHSYHLEESALANLLLRDDVRRRPVIVVSVAGAYRGGKSFLQDFFLRYWHASPTNRLNGSWLGAEDEPLTGFSWRGGSERDTTGILLWSEPIFATLPSGEKVVVILMDTQGTFDTHSTVRDCSTVFALSTLLASVQIYNISQNIREDDLQHLQLFTEYGRLAANHGGQAFQSLQFLIRDWTFPYEHPYGTAGGLQLLEKRLEINDRQPAELRELREHIRSCFQSVTCFLMPHPGFAVSDKNFNGRLADIREEFRMSLLELVPSIFDQQHLKPKMINGQVVTAEDLFNYFKTYMNIFNSEDLPTPVSILKATTDANMLMAMSGARRQYEAALGRLCASGAPSVKANKLRNLHDITLQNISDEFLEKKMLGTKETVSRNLETLKQELEARLAQYIIINEGKIKKSIADAKEIYEKTMNSMGDSSQLCLHPKALDELHAKALRTAVGQFESNRVQSEEGSDDDKTALILTLEDRLKHYRLLNERNNVAAVNESRNVYQSFMESKCGSPTCTSPGRLLIQHDKALARARATLHSRRSLSTEHPDDIYETQLTGLVNELFSKLQIINKNSNKSAVQAGMFSYNEYMNSICGPMTRSLHPDDLQDEHHNARNGALNTFHSKRKITDLNDANDTDKDELIQTLTRRYGELCDMNEANNRATVEAAYNSYCRYMEYKCGPSLLSVLVVPFIIKLLVMLPEHHKTAKKAALKVFWEKRRTGSKRSRDRHLEELEDMVKAGYTKYCDPIKATARELGIPVGNEI